MEFCIFKKLVHNKCFESHGLLCYLRGHGPHESSNKEAERDSYLKRLWTDRPFL